MAQIHDTINIELPNDEIEAPPVPCIVVSQSDEEPNAMSVSVNDVHAPLLTLNIDLRHDPDEIEPIFSGGCWAGTVLWAAALAAIEHVVLHEITVGDEPKSVLELGCGLGVPGMVAAARGADVTLTEQPNLIPLLLRNVETNFQEQKPSVVELSWGTESAGRFQEDYPEPFDLVLVCDCVFEPLYGDSWKLLCDCIEVLTAGAGRCTRVVVSLERRGSDDGVLPFLDRLRQFLDVERVWYSYTGLELENVLKYSHVGSELKPVEIYSCQRKS